MRTSFHHQPEAQHPNFPLSTSCRPITPSLEGNVLQNSSLRRKAQLSNPSLWDMACSSSLSPACQLFLAVEAGARPDHSSITGS